MKEPKQNFIGKKNCTVFHKLHMEAEQFGGN
jgi:hypothetical protein